MINKSLTKEQILARWKKIDWSSVDTKYPTLEEMDTMAYYNEQYLKETGWNERGIAFYSNEKYENEKYKYWFDCNATQFTCYRYDKETKTNSEVSHDFRNEESPYLNIDDIAEFITWLDTAIGHEAEYDLSV